MFRHTKLLQFEAKPEKPDPVYAHKLQELIGGAFGEMSVTMQYLFQGWNCRVEGKYKDLIMDTATEEIGHVEMLATMVARLLEGAPATATAEAVKDPVMAAVIGGMDPQQAIVAGGGALPADSNGYPWNGRYIVASGNLLADFRANAAAEAQGRLQTARLYNMTDDPGVKAMLKFNLARDTVHQKQWLAAIEELEADGLEGPIAPTALFDEEDQTHNRTIWHLSDGPDGPAVTTDLEYLMDPEPLGGPGTAPKPDPALYSTYPAESSPLEPAEGDVETFHDGEVWKNKVVGNSRASGSAEKKSDAVAAGRKLAIKRGTAHFIHTKDGRVGERRTYPRAR
ncbi:manganese catalase family protein [Amycolatopsis sp. MEPSY49]|uniref:manganese catalase family protein n=1 Tax=Amycolatopsis sp. MEPSY49 TaxID=3151600 RepID=UPI003F511444